MVTLLVRGTRLFAKTLFYVFSYSSTTQTTHTSPSVCHCGVHFWRPSWKSTVPILGSPHKTKQGDQTLFRMTNGSQPVINLKSHAGVRSLTRSCLVHPSWFLCDKQLSPASTKMTQYTEAKKRSTPLVWFVLRKFSELYAEHRVGCLCLCHAMFPRCAYMS